MRKRFLLMVLVGFAIATALAVPAIASQIGSPPDVLSQSAPISAPMSGRALYQAGRVSEAIATWERELATLEDGSNPIRQAIVLSYLALSYQQLGDWERAEAAIARSANLLEQTSAPTALAKVLNVRGQLQLAKGDATTALTTWRQAETLYRVAGDAVGTAGVQINQAQALRALGLYRRARLLLEQVTQTLSQQPDSGLKAQALLNLGDTLRILGDWSVARETLEHALAVARRIASTSDTQAALLSLGNIHRALGNLEAAQSAYQQAIALSACGSDVPPSEVVAGVCLSDIQVQLDFLDLLIDTQQRSQVLALLPNLWGRVSTLPPAQLGIYAKIDLVQSLQRVGAIALPSNEPFSSPLAQAQLLAQAVQDARLLGDKRAESYALGELAHLYEGNGQQAESQKLTEQALYLAQAIAAPEITYRWQWQLGRLQRSQDPDAAIAAYAEATYTLQNLSGDLVAMQADLRFSFREQVEPVYREYVDLLLAANPSTQSEQQRYLEQAREAIEALQLAELDNFFREACLNVTPQPLDRLDPRAAALYTIILPDRLEAILSVPGQPMSHYAAPVSQTEVEAWIDRTRQSFRRTSFAKERLPLAQELYRWLIQPAEAQLASGNIDTLVFVLDGALREIPMAVLHDGNNYLIERYRIAIAPGLQVLVPAVADNIPKRTSPKALLGGVSEASQGFAPLPGVERELSQIQSRLPAETLLNEAFTSNSLQAQLQQNAFTILHLATHGQFSSNPEDTFILTWNSKIKVRELQDLLQTQGTTATPLDLLVLSACETASGDDRAVLGMAGMAVRSGARTTLATLWAVQDRSTTEFMVRFYEELMKPGVAKAEALRRAQLALLRGEYNHPYHWAPFVLVGNWL